MRTLLLICGLAVLTAGCTKEVGKEPYAFELTFSTGEVIPFTAFIYEKAKDYENGNVSHNINTHKQTNSIYLESDPLPGMDLILVKKDEKKLIGINDLNAWRTSEQNFAGGAEVQVYGIIEMDGDYTKKGKKFTVNNGVFTITWTNSSDYGEPANKVLTGTWTLHRK